AVSSDSRDYAEHATRGGLYQARWSVYADRGDGTSSFQRLETIVNHYKSLSGANWVLALRADVVLSRAVDGDVVPFYLMPNLGGRNDRGYRDFRFHDRNMQTYSVESRWALYDHLDTVLFVDAGNVAPSPRTLWRTALKPSYGAGVRLHNN